MQVKLNKSRNRPKALLISTTPVSEILCFSACYKAKNGKVYKSALKSIQI